MTTTKPEPPFDAGEVLRLVGEITAAFEAASNADDRQTLLQLREAVSNIAPVVYTLDQRAEAEEDFETLAAIEALETLILEIETVCDRKLEALLQQCLDVYYAAEELSRQPEHAHLIPHVENLRAAYFRDYGTEIPKRVVQ